MNDLIHKIVGAIIEVGQSDVEKFRLGETIRYTPSEILEILKQHENEIFGEESSTQPNDSNTLNALDCVSRVQALNNIKSLYPEAPRINFMDNLAQWKKKYSQYMECERVIENLPPAQPERKWIPCRERMPECEQEVLICTMKKIYVSRKSGMEWYEEPIITPALYEDGTMLEVNSKWRWEDIDYVGWDEEEDCGIIPEGWWENRHFNPDDVYNNPVDQEVIAWMPLPEPYKEGEQDE